MLLLAAAFLAGPVHAAVSVRVEARPVEDPIEALVTVTDANGDPVSDLTTADFTVLVDGVTVPSPTFSLPPAQDPNQRVSVVFAMDYSGSVQEWGLAAMQDAVLAFINAMQPGDYAALVKFNKYNPEGASVVQPFTEIDGGTGNAALTSALLAPYPDPSQGNQSTNLYDAVVLSVQQFNLPATVLPSGPKAVILISDGGENASSVNFNTVLTTANQSGIAVFTIGVGSIANDATALQIMTQLAEETGGHYLAAPNDAEVGDAYVTISHLLNNEYLLTFASTITDCGTHTLEVRVTGQAAATQTFTRCTPKPPSDSNGGGGGGGGATDLLEVLAGLALVTLRRRRPERRRPCRSEGDAPTLP